MLGPEEFAEGLGIGLKSFFGGTVGQYSQIEPVSALCSLYHP